jgi:outer membrane protein OmpA-like peptidoglycan-associated protein
VRILVFYLLLLSPGCWSQQSERLSIYFKFNDHSLDARSADRIDSFIQNKNIEHIYLHGHCDSIGNNAYNDALSAKRVSEVQKHLFAKRITEDLIEIKASGKRIALNKNQTEAERALNRRVEIELILKPSPASNKDIVPAPVPVAKETEISGIVVNEKNRPVITEIILNDKNGIEIQKIISGQNGKYKLKAVLNPKEDYSLTFFNDSSFIAAKRINLSEKRLPYKNLRTILPELKGGHKYILENLNFVGDTSQLIAASLPSLEALYKLMQKNKSLVIRIEGHVNHPLQWGYKDKDLAHKTRYFPPEISYKEANQWLSEERAKAVYNYLLSKGIDPKRMSTIGYGNTKMLFPYATRQDEQEQNRRVEINVISFKK